MYNLAKFFIEIDKLKRTYRFSTRDASVRDSSADHSWELTLMTISVAEHLSLDVDIMHSVKLALCHDIPEYLTGEIDSKLIYNGDVTEEHKSKLERKALEDLCVRYGKIGKEIYDLWEEFEKGNTKEAKYVKALDKIEATTHLISLGEFENLDYTVTYADDAVRIFPELIPLLKDIKKRLREESEKAGKKWKKDYDVF